MSFQCRPNASPIAWGWPAACHYFRMRLWGVVGQNAFISAGVGGGRCRFRYRGAGAMVGCRALDLVALEARFCSRPQMHRWIGRRPGAVFLNYTGLWPFSGLTVKCGAAIRDNTTITQRGLLPAAAFLSRMMCAPMGARAGRPQEGWHPAVYDPCGKHPPTDLFEAPTAVQDTEHPLTRHPPFLGIRIEDDAAPIPWTSIIRTPRVFVASGLDSSRQGRH